MKELSHYEDLGVFGEYLHREILRLETVMHKHCGAKAMLRTCASCEWIFWDNGVECPVCGFASYGARYVYGKKAYEHAKTQQPWIDRKVTKYQLELMGKVEKMMKEKNKSGRDIKNLGRSF